MSKIPGGPNPAGVNMMRVGATQGAVGTSKRYHWQQPAWTEANGNITTNEAAKNEFPIVPVGPDPYDDIANIKSQYGKPNNVGANWVVPFEASDAAYLMRKRDAEEKAQFDAWVTQKYDLTDPAQNMMLQSIAPELYQRREEVIDTQQALVSKYAKVRLRGAKSLDDLYLEWLIETGRIDLPQGPIWDPLRWRAAQGGGGPAVGGAAKDLEWNRKRYNAGFFSPLRWMSETQSGRAANTANRFDITGTDDPYQNARVPFYEKGGSLYAPRYPDPHPSLQYTDPNMQAPNPQAPKPAQ